MVCTQKFLLAACPSGRRAGWAVHRFDLLVLSEVPGVVLCLSAQGDGAFLRIGTVVPPPSAKTSGIGKPEGAHVKEASGRSREAALVCSIPQQELKTYEGWQGQRGMCGCGHVRSDAPRTALLPGDIVFTNIYTYAQYVESRSPARSCSCGAIVKNSY